MRYRVLLIILVNSLISVCCTTNITDNASNITTLNNKSQPINSVSENSNSGDIGGRDKLVRIKDAENALKKFSRNFKIENLKDKELLDGEFELRMWADQETLLNCFIINHNNNWSAVFFKAQNVGGNLSKIEKTSSNDNQILPKSGWENVSTFLAQNKIDIPFPYILDADDVLLDPDEGEVVLEIKKGSSYRMVFYRKFTETKDGKNVIKVCSYFQNEFSIDMGCPH